MASPSRRTQALLALGLLIVSAALRFGALGAKGLWFDEIHSINDVVYPRPLSGAHWFFFKVTGLFFGLASNPTVGVRLYAALAGALAPPILFLFVSRLFSPAAGLIAGAMLLLQPAHLSHSQEGRFYAPMVLFSIAALWSALEFAWEARPRRFVWLSLALLFHLFGAANHPAAAPYAMGHIGALFALVTATPWGLDAARQAIPPLRRAARPKTILLGAGAAVAICALIVFGGLRARVTQALHFGQWGSTPGVSFSPAFFVGHLLDFGLDLRAAIDVPWVSWAPTLLLALVGFVLLARRQPTVALWFAATILAVLAAVFAFQTQTQYQTKYTEYLQPILLALIAGALAELAASTARLAPRLFPPGRPLAAAVAIAALLVAAQIPGAVRYYQRERMPLRPQFRWLEEREPQSARLYVYGHAGYPASLYKSELPSRFELRHFPWEQQRTGALEVEVVKNSAARRPTYFAHCWPFDMPPLLIEFLRREGKVVARFPALDGPERDGILFRVDPPSDEEDRRAASRPAWQLDAWGAPGRPSVKLDAEGHPAALRFGTAATAVYDIPVKAAQPSMIEIEIEVERRGFYFVTAAAGDAKPALLGGLCEAGKPVVWRGRLAPTKDADHVEINFVSDYMTEPKIERPFMIRRFAVRPAGDAPPEGEILLPPPHQILPGRDYPAHKQDWRVEPAGTIGALAVPGEDILHIRPLGGEKGVLLSPVFKVVPAGILQARARVTPREAYGWGATLEVVFSDKEGKVVSHHELSRAPMSCNVDWDPWIAPLRSDPWNKFEIVIPTPPNAAQAAIALSIWPTTGARRVANAANEFLLGEIDYVAAPNPFLPAARAAAPPAVPHPIQSPPLATPPAR